MESETAWVPFELALSDITPRLNFEVSDDLNFVAHIENASGRQQFVQVLHERSIDRTGPLPAFEGLCKTFALGNPLGWGI
jgi:hypothetical protein